MQNNCPDKVDIMLSYPANIAYGTKDIPNTGTKGKMGFHRICL